MSTFLASEFAVLHDVLLYSKPYISLSFDCLYSLHRVHRPKFISIGGGWRLPIWVKLSTGGVFFRCSVGKAHSRPLALEPHILSHINRRGLAKDVLCLWEVSSIHLIPWGSYPSNTPHFRDVSGDFQLKRLRAYLGTEETYHNAVWVKMRISARYAMYSRKKKRMGSFQGSDLHFSSKTASNGDFKPKHPVE